MKTIRTLLALGFSLATAHSGTFSTTAWTDDASTYIEADKTAWAYRFGSITPATVNTIPVTGIASASPSPYTNANFDLALPTPQVLNDDTNALTALGGPGSAVMAKDFVYSNASGGVASVTVKGLTDGVTYTVSFFSVGWQGDPDDTIRSLTFSSGSDSRIIAQRQFGSDKGIRVDYTFAATVATRLITITPQNPSYRFHLYGLALRQETAPTTVTNTNDSGPGPGSLRWALANAKDRSGPDTIIFAPALSGQTITLDSEIVIADAAGVTVDASALAAGVTINGGAGTNRIFSVSAGANVTLTGLTLTGGNGSGATDSGYGGAIYNGGTLTLTQCTLSGNVTYGGSGGAISNSGTLTLTQCTLSGNSANYGGGIRNYGTLTVNQSTLSGNSAGEGGGGIRRNNGSTLTLTNSIVAGNIAGSGPDFSGVGVITPVGANLIGNNVTVSTEFPFNLPLVGQTGNLANPQLAPLGNYGGPTQTMPPLAGSPAIDGGVGSIFTTDQRGVAIAGVPDIGAVENGSRVTTAVDQLDTPAGSSVSLREAVRDCPAGGVIDFAPALSGAVTLTTALGGEVVLGKSVTIDASNLTGGVTIDGGAGTNRIFTVSSGQSVLLRALTLTGGNATGATDSGNGGAIRNAGTLTVERCLLTGNNATSQAGAILNPGTLTLTDCTLSANISVNQGGAVLNSGSLTAVRCTFSGNTTSINGGAIANDSGTANFTSCTFSGNTQTGGTQGGGALNHASSATSLTLTHCTIAGNSATGSNGGGGIRNRGPLLTLNNCIVAGNTISVGTGADVNSTVTVTRGGACLIGSNATITTVFPAGAPNANGDYVGTSASWVLAQLAPLGNYGGPTQTRALLPGSPARDAGGTSSFTTDQRGFPIIGIPDIGAYEAGTFTNYNAWIYETLPATATVPQHATTFDFDGDGISNLIEYTLDTSPVTPSVMPAASMYENAGTRYIKLVWTRPDNRGDAVLVGETSADLSEGSWSPASVVSTISPTGPGAQTIEFLFSEPIGLAQRRFLRVRVELTSSP